MINILYGFIIAAFMLIPGVSGGSIAIQFGIYGKIIDCVANFKKNFKNNLFFLISLLIGALISAIIFSNLFKFIFNKYEYPIRIILGTVFLCNSFCMITKNNYNKKINGIISTIIGVIFPIIFLFLFIFKIDSNNVLHIFIISIPLSLALILPGISFSYCLFVLRIYQDILDAISDFNISILTAISFGIILGILLFTKLIDFFMKKHFNIFESTISGFVLISSLQIIPYNFLFNNNLSFLYIILGLIIFYIIKSFSKKQGV